MKRTLAAVTAALLMIGLVSSTALAGSGASIGGSAKAVYNAIPASVSANVPSLGFEATATNEFGDAVALGGSARSLQSMSVLLSSFACTTGHWDTVGGNCVTTPGATFPVPLTFTIYDFTGGTKGAQLAQQTQIVNVLYRPSASSKCAGADAGKWYNTSDKSCNNGLPQTFKMTFSGGTLTDQVVWTVAYSTSGFGPVPYGYGNACNSTAAGCPYDSLNVGAKSFEKAPYAGTDLDEDQAFRNGVMETGWTGFRPLGAITAK